jgi:uncharacterized membrane protein
MPRRVRFAEIARSADELRHLTATPAGRLLAAAVAAIAVLTLIGLAALWPHGWKPDGGRVLPPTVPAEVVAATVGPCAGSEGITCRNLTIEVDGRRFPLGLGTERTAPKVEAGQGIRVTRDLGVEANPRTEPYHFVEIERQGSLLWLGVVVALLATVLLRWRGVLAVAGVALSLAVLLEFLVPAILAGRPALLTALVASLTVMFITIVLTNGFGAQTLAAALGVTATLVLTCFVALLAANFAQIDGRTEGTAITLGLRNGGLSLQGIVLAAMLIGALGVLADTAVTQASAVMALRRANPLLGARDLYREGFTVGRDHLSATIHTLVLAYAGAVLPLLLILRSGSVGRADVLDTQTIAEPIVATVVGCLALIAAVPLTTGLAALLIARVPPGSLPDGGHHHHH